MSLTLQRFANGDTGYVGKHNANAEALEDAVNALQTQLTQTIDSAGAFTGLTDTPASYSGQGLKVVRVSVTEDSLEFSAAADPTTFVGLTDTPAAYTSAGGKHVRVNAGATALEFITANFTGLADTPNDYSGQSGKLVSVKSDETGLEFSSSASPDTLLGLTDTPSAYTGAAGKVLRVKSDVTGIEFSTESVGATVFTELGDAPVSYSGQAGKAVLVKGDETGLEFSTFAPTAFTGLSDAPASYAGQAYRTVIVDGTETGLIFADAATPTAFIGLTDVPASYSGAGGKSLAVKADASGVEFVAQPYDVGGGVTGKPTASQVLLRYPFPRAVTFPSGLTGSRGVGAVAATAQTDFDIQKNGGSVGTMRFPALGTNATFVMETQTTFAAGDILTILAPASPDATLADLGFALAGTR